MPEDEWLKLARELAGRGDWRLALRALYLGTLGHLAARELVSLARFKSNRDYQLEVARRARGNPDLRRAFEENVARFDRVWYGLYAVSSEGYGQLGECGKDPVMLKRSAMLLGGLLLIAGFAGGVIRLFDLRFARGDVYPPYSTLRSDPLGASALFESLNRVPGLAARRYFEPTFKESDGQERTLMVLGLDPWELQQLPRTEFSTLQQFVYHGGRLVMAYSPVIGARPAGRESPAPADEADKPRTKDNKTTNNIPSQKKVPAAKSDKSGGDDKKARTKPRRTNRRMNRRITGTDRWNTRTRRRNGGSSLPIKI